MSLDPRPQHRRAPRASAAITGAAAALAMLLSAAPAPAEANSRPLPVRAGEHKGYSRLVVQRPRGVEWTVREINGGVEIRFKKPDLAFDTKDVLERRMAHRVTAMEVKTRGDETVLKFGYNCECKAEITNLGGRRVMLDVSESEGPTSTVAKYDSDASEAAKDKDKDKPKTDRLRRNPLPEIGAALSELPQSSDAAASSAPASDDNGADLPQSADSGPTPIAPPATNLEAQTVADVGASVENQELAPPTPQLEDRPEDETEKSDVERAQQFLLEQLQRAAAEGLIEFQPGAEAPIVDNADAQATPAEASAADPNAGGDASADPVAADPAGADAAAAASARAADAQPLPPVDASPTAPRSTLPRDWSAPETADADPRPALADVTFDGGAEFAETGGAIDAPSTEEDTALTAADQPVCLPGQSFDVADWGDDRKPFYETLGQLRSTLYDRLNNVAPGAVVDLARFYFANELYIEAIATPRTFGVDTDDALMVVALAEAMKGMAPRRGAILSGATRCEGPHGVWQAGAQAETAPERALRFYREDPRALLTVKPPYRRFLGAKLMKAAVVEGDFVLAREIQDFLERNSAPPTAELLWAEAALEMEDGSITKGRQALKRLMAMGGDGAPLATAALADSLGGGVPLDDVAEMTGALEDYATQYRGSEIGARSAIAQAYLVARFGDLSSAVSILDRYAEDVPGAAAKVVDAKNTLIERDVAAAIAEPTPERLTIGVQAAELLGEEDGYPMRLALAEALIENGAHALAPMVLTEQILERSSTARDLMQTAKRSIALTPAPSEVAANGPLDQLRQIEQPEYRLDNPIASGRALIDVLGAELEILKEIAKDE